MNFDFMDRRSAERFAELLDESTGGRRHHSRGPADEQLAELVAIGSSLSQARSAVRVDAEFRTGLRAMLVATAERDGIGRTATAVENEPARQAMTRGAGLRAGLLGRGGRRIRARGAIVIGVAAGAMAVSGISAASENASPGDALYGVKRSTERAQLAMAGSDVTRGQLSLDFARNRLAEAASMPGSDLGFAGVLEDMDADTRKGVKLLTQSAVARTDSKPLSTIDDFVGRQRGTLTPVLGKLAPANQDRAAESLKLLESVQQRADDLRTGLDCKPVTQAGADTLGPKLKDCRSTADSTAPSRTNGHSGKSTTKPKGADSDDAKPRKTGPAVAPEPSDTAEPDPTGETAGPGPDLAPLGGTGDTPSPSETPAGRSSKNGGVLDGLLGNLF